MNHEHSSSAITSTPAAETTSTTAVVPQKVHPKAPPRAMQPVSGVTAPQTGEAIIREAWPTLASSAGLSALGAKLIMTVFLAPLGWMLLAPLLLKKFAPFICRRYLLSNRRLAIRRGLKPAVVEEVPLAEIDEVRLDPASTNKFFRCADLQIVSKGQVKMTLTAVPEADSFRMAILNACAAWVPGKAATMNPFQSAAAASKV